MTGRLIAVVGPSGVGKDSVMAGLCARCPGLSTVQRVITRDSDLGGEEFISVGTTDFAARRDAGEFVLHWGAHGLFYGIPRGVLVDLAAGQDLVANLSRGVLGQAAALFPQFTVLHLTASPDVLAGRLSGRGRESAADIAARLARAGDGLPGGLPAGLNLIEITNDGPLDVTVSAALAALYPESA